MGQACHFAAGAFVGTGAELHVRYDMIGFRPSFIEIFNVTSGIGLKWIEGMGDASGIKTAQNGDRTLVATNGITPEATGFTLGTDSVNGATEQLRFVAWR